MKRLIFLLVLVSSLLIVSRIHAQGLCTGGPVQLGNFENGSCEDADGLRCQSYECNQHVGSCEWRGTCDYGGGVIGESCGDYCPDVGSSEVCPQWASDFPCVIGDNCGYLPNATPYPLCQNYGGGGGGSCNNSFSCSHIQASANGNVVQGVVQGQTPQTLTINSGDEVFFNARNMNSCATNDWYFDFDDGKACTEHFDTDGNSHAIEDTFYCAKDTGNTYGAWSLWNTTVPWGVPVTPIPLQLGPWPQPTSIAQFKQYCRPWCHAGDIRDCDNDPDTPDEQCCVGLGQGYDCEVRSPYTEDGSHNKSIVYADGKAYKVYNNPGTYDVLMKSLENGNNHGTCTVRVVIATAASPTPTATSTPAPTIRIRGRTEVTSSGGSSCSDANYYSAVTVRLRNPTTGNQIGSDYVTNNNGGNGYYTLGAGQTAGSYLVCAVETANYSFDQGSKTSPYNSCSALITPPGNHPNEQCLSYTNISGDLNNGRIDGYTISSVSVGLACYDYDTSTHKWSVQADWVPNASGNIIVDDDPSYSTPWKMNNVGAPPQTSSHNIDSRTNIYTKLVYQSNPYYPDDNPTQCDNCQLCYGTNYCGSSQSCTGTICSNFTCVTPTTTPSPTSLPTPTATPRPLSVGLACYDYNTATHKWAVQALWSPNVSAAIIIDDEASYSTPWKLNTTGNSPQTSSYNIDSRTNIYTRVTYQSGQNYSVPNPATCDNCQLCLGSNYCGSSQSCTGTICSNFTCVTPTLTPAATNTPTPTSTSAPTPTSTPGAWIKLSNACFSTANGFTMNIPSTVTSYDGSGDDPGNPYFIEKEAGVMSANGTIKFNQLNPSAKASFNNWQNSGYSFTSNSLMSFVDYVKSRKEYVKHTNISQFESNKINFIEASSLTMTSLPGNGVLIVTNGSGLGNVTINADLSGTSDLAIIANNITFSEGAQNVRGIFIANTATINNFSNPINAGLKINGNLILTGILTNNRRRTNNNQPTVLIVANPQMYVTILPYLSTSTYEWKQLQ